LRKEAEKAPEGHCVHEMLKNAERYLSAGIGTNIEYLGGEIEIEEEDL
jgi:hypothetical protein